MLFSSAQHAAHLVNLQNHFQKNIDACSGDSSPDGQFYPDVNRNRTNCPTKEVVNVRSNAEDEDGQNDIHVSSHTNGMCPQNLDGQVLCSPNTDDNAQGKRKADQICADFMDMNDYETDDITSPPVLKKIKPFDVIKSSASERMIVNTCQEKTERNEVVHHDMVDIVPMKRMKSSQEDGSDSTVLSTGRWQSGEHDKQVSTGPTSSSRESLQPAHEPCVEARRPGQKNTSTATCDISAEDMNVVEDIMNETSSTGTGVLFGLSAPERIKSKEDDLVTKECQLLLLFVVEQVQEREGRDLQGVGTSEIHTSDACWTTQLAVNPSSCLQTANSQKTNTELSGSLDVDHSGAPSVTSSTTDVEEAQEIPTSSVVNALECIPFGCVGNLLNNGEIMTEVDARDNDMTTTDAQCSGVAQGLSSVDVEEVNLCMDSDPASEEPLLAGSECGALTFDITDSSFTCCFTPASQLLSQDDQEMQDGFLKDVNVTESDKSRDSETMTGRECTMFISVGDAILEETLDETVTDLRPSEPDLLTTTSLMQTLPQDPDEVIPILTHQELESLGSKHTDQLSSCEDLEATAGTGIGFRKENIPTRMVMKDGTPRTQIVKDECATVRGRISRSNVPTDGSQETSSPAKAKSDDQTVPSLATPYLEDAAVDMMLEIEESIHSEQGKRLASMEYFTQSWLNAY